MSLPIPTRLPTAYETAYRVLNPPSHTLKERRAVERHPFRFVQRIAAYDGQDRLDQLRFFPVQCHDISRRGVSFVLPGRLDFSRLVLELGSNGDWMYFEAEVANFRVLSGDLARSLKYREAIASSSQPVLIGCRFRSRLNLECD